MALKPPEITGYCPMCGSKFALTNDLALPAHKLPSSTLGCRGETRKPIGVSHSNKRGEK